ncbi:gluconokinase, GntK/IdnK-type [soil metagenome]
MGVAGCGKSTVGALVARAEHLAFVDGDAFHSAVNLAKMKQGIALTDEDREGWLDLLGDQLKQGGIVLASSALRRIYRDRLRRASNGLRFVYLDITREEARRRVEGRASRHFFSPSLVDDQFATLEDPTGEPGVLRVDATDSLQRLQDQIHTWLTQESPA